MSMTDTSGMNIAALRRLLGESDRDVAALSREEADRIIAIPDLDRRLRAYLGLREVWAYGGDRLLAEDDARIQASFSGSGVAGALAPPPAPPSTSLPLTPVSLLGWAEGWRTALVASAVNRGAQAGGPRDVGELEALAAAGPDVPKVYLPELVLLRQLDTLISELREGLEARQLLPGEALPGDIHNLPGLLKATSAARARREIEVPPAPALPGQRCTINALLAWLEALLLFEESVGARALLQAGIVAEPGAARARFLAASRGDLADIDGHAAAQIGSWRRADAVHRAVDLALRGRWLTRARTVMLPSFEVAALEAFFLAFAGGIPALAPATGPATPEDVVGWWTQRRAMALRSMALTLLAEGALVGTEHIDQRAEELAVRGLVQALPELAVLAEADRVLAACRAVLALDVQVGTVKNVGDGAAVLREWGHYLARPGELQRPPLPQPGSVAAGAPAGLFPVSVSVAARARLPEAPKPHASKADASTAVAPLPALPFSDGPVATDVPPPVAALAAPTAATSRLVTWRASLRSAVGRAWFPLVGIAGIAIFQGGALLLAATGGENTFQAERALRLARLGDPLWLAQGGLAVLALLVASTEMRAGLSAFLASPWSVARWGRLSLAVLLLVAAYLMPAPSRFVASAEGFAAWPERVVTRGGVPISTLVASEGLWLRGVALEPMATDDLPTVEAGAAPLALLREVGPFGRHGRWLVANRADVEAVMGRSMDETREALAASLRRENAR